MNAVRIRSFGGPEVLELADVELESDQRVLIPGGAGGIGQGEPQTQLEQGHAQGKVVLQMG
jgi:hypothetical protein